MNFKKTLKGLFVAISLSVVLLISAFLYGRVSLLTIIVIGILVFGLHVFLLKRRAKNLVVLLASLYILYFALEFVSYLLICAEILRPDFYSIQGDYFGASDRPYVRFDSISGYKYVSGTPRVTKVDEGNLVYDHIMPVNSRGYCSIFDYPFKKPDKSKKRLMILGDSFSAGEITDTTWVDLLNLKLASASKPVELFNFGLEAIGIKNWHNIFFKEIIPNYEFDGIVIANFGDVDYYSSDMARPFAIKHSFSDHSTIGFTELLPATQNGFRDSCQSKLYYESSIYPSEYIDHHKHLAMHDPDARRSFRFQPLHLYFLHFVTDAYDFIREYNAMKSKYILKEIDPQMLKRDVTSWNDFDIYYGKKSILTKEILDWCQTNHKEIYFISIPSFNIASEDSVNYHKNVYNRQLKFLAQKYDGRFLDGFAMLDSMPRARDTEFHLYGDSHWNRKGIDLFLKTVPLSFFDRTD